MSIYKIINTSNLLGKRSLRYNSPVEIEYVNNLVKEKISIKAGDIAYINLPSLPISVHKLRAENLIAVSEVSITEMNAVLQSKITFDKARESVVENTTDTTLKFSKKKPIKKEPEE